MPASFIWIAIFLISLAVLVKGSDYFTDAVEKVGLYFKIPAFIVGVCLLTLGTTLPEMVSSIFAVINNSSEIAAGTVVGSNITNIFLILGVAVLFSKEQVEINYNLLSVDLPLLIGSAFLLSIAAWDGIFTSREAVFFVFLFILYGIYNASKEKNRRTKELGAEVKKEYKKGGGLSRMTFVIMFFSAVLIYFGAKYTIEAVINLSGIFNIGKDLIATTAVALGTSLPELFVSISAARKGHAEMAAGNILGANMFNTFGVMGIAGLFGQISIGANVLTFGIPMMLIATILYFFITQDKEITKWEGVILISFYIMFLGKFLNWF
ncbi:MAG: calcium/sodium antiporter [bacterium]